MKAVLYIRVEPETITLPAQWSRSGEVAQGFAILDENKCYNFKLEN